MTRARRILRTAAPHQWRNRILGAAVLLLACGAVVWLLGVSFEGAARTVALLTALALGMWGASKFKP